MKSPLASQRQYYVGKGKIGRTGWILWSTIDAKGKEQSQTLLSLLLLCWIEEEVRRESRNEKDTQRITTTVNRIVVKYLWYGVTRPTEKVCQQNVKIGIWKDTR